MGFEPREVARLVLKSPKHYGSSLVTIKHHVQSWGVSLKGHDQKRSKDDIHIT